MTRLERSLALLREVNAHRLLMAPCRDSERKRHVLAAWSERLAQHDRDARAKVDPRQLTIWDAVAARR